MTPTRTAVLTGTLLVSLLGVSACSGGSSNDSNSSAPQSKDQAACKETPVSGGSLTYARAQETLTLNPIAVRNGNGDIFADAMIYQGLVQYDPEGSKKIVGAVADTWDVSDDGRVYTFHIRDGVKFSDGEPVTAEDVKFSLDRFGDPDVNQLLSNLATGYGGSKILADDSVQITLTQAVPSFLDNIAVFPAFIVPKKLVESQGDAFWKKPVGSGPYAVKDFVGGSRLELTRNTYYWEPKKPYVDDVTFNFATDSNARLLALESGEAQMADGIEPSQFDKINANSALGLKGESGPQWIGLYFNTKTPELADKKVRQAISAALDRKAINEQIFGGLAGIPNSIFAELRYDASTSEVPAFEADMAEAKKLMAESGYPDGFSTTLTFPAGTEFFNQISLAVQQQLSEIGVKLKLAKVDPATMGDEWAAEKFDMSFVFPGTSSDVAVPDEYAAFFADPDVLNGFHTGWKNAKIEDLVNTFISTPDEAARAEQWPVIQAAFNDEVPMTNLLNLPFFVAHSTSVCGTGVNALGIDQLQNTWIVD
jgi:peptide/nickel transport system substrate-binding protein